MSLTGGGARRKRWRRPHERGLSVPKEPALLRDLEVNQTAVHGPRHDRLDRLPLPWSARRRTEGRAQRHVSARAQHEGGREGTPLPLGPYSTIARDVMTEPPLCQLSPASRAHFGGVAEHGFTGWPSVGLVRRFRPPVLVGFAILNGRAVPPMFRFHSLPCRKTSRIFRNRVRNRLLIDYAVKVLW
jgi:hypothetical protein